MSAPLSCTKCGNLLAVESASGLCPACAPAAEPATHTFVPGAPAGEPGTLTFPAPAPPPSDTPNAAANPTPPATAHPNPLAPTLTSPADALTASGPAAPPTPAKAPRPLPADPVGYTLLDRIGEGGMGEVFRAHEHSTDQFVALKMIDPRHGGGSYFERFRLEFRALANFEHPNAVRGLKDRFDHDPPFFTMELVPGCTVSERLKHNGPYEPRAAVELILKVARALQALHDHREFGHPFEGVIHRDIKPSNILLTTDNEPKLADFGLVRYLDAETITSADVALGTPAYMPPEQCGGRHDAISYPADVYGLGATLYHMLTGEPPFRGTLVEIIAQVLHDDPKPVCERCPEVGEMLGRIVRACMYKQPEDRYQTVGALIADLDKWLNPKAEAPPTPPEPPPTPEQPRANWVKRNAMALAACALLVVGSVLALVWPSPAPPEPRLPDPEVERENRLKVIHADLLAGKPVELVGDRGEPRWHTTPIAPLTFAPNPRRTATDPGGCYFSSNGLSILHLLDPPLDAYRLELCLQHTNGKFTTEPALGVFTGYRQVGGRDGWTEHQFLSVGFADIGRPNAKRVPTSRVRLASHVCAHAPGGLPVPIAAPSLKEPEFATAEVFAGLWRKVVIDVTPARFVCYWDADPNAPGAVPTFDFTLDALRKHQRLHDTVLGDTGAALDHTFAPLIPWSPRGGVGVWTMRADVAIKNVVITPK